MPQKVPKGETLILSFLVLPAAFLISTIIYAFVPLFIEPIGTGLPTSALLALIAFSLMVVFSGIYVGQFRTDPRGWEVFEDKAIPAPSHGEPETPGSYLARSKVAIVIVCALLEAPALLGLVICIMGNPLVIGYGLMALSFVAVLLFIRRVVRIIGAAVKMQMYVDSHSGRLPE